jgi:hypothetical protein
VNFPAFKEWHAIVGVLGAGEQSLILRKGGIAEGRGGFQVEATRFWLFPTSFHAQREKTKPAAARWFSSDSATPAQSETPSPASTLDIQFFADVVRTAFLSDWQAVARLDSFHFWTEDTVRERFHWSRPPGVHVLLVRIHRLDTPVTLPLTPAMTGCKSWVDFPINFATHPSRPILDDDAFNKLVTTLPL